MDKVKLGEVASIIMGQSPQGKKVSAVKNGLPLLNGPAEFTSKYPIPVQYTTEEKRLAEKNDILFCVRGSTTGRMNIADQNYVIGRGLAAIRHKKDRFLNVYIKALIENNLKKLLGGTLGSVFPNLTKDNLFNLECLIHSESQQRQIASLLSALDAKIELNNKINAELEAMAKLIYDYWFVQFDFPYDFAQDKVADETSNPKDVKPYKSSGGKMLYNEELKREIPEGWEVKELGEELMIQRGISYKSSEIKGNGIPMINLNSFNLDGTYKAKGIKMYSGKYADKNLLESGDLLIAVTDVTRNADIIGKAILVPDYYSELICSMDIAKIIPSNKISGSYLKMLFNSEHYHNYIKWFASGTIVLHLNLDGMKWYKSEIPPKTILDRFDALHQPIAKRINATEKQNKQLAELRNWLLPMLMNGQVTVKGAYEKMEEVGLAAEGEGGYESTSKLSIPANKKGFAKLVLAGKIIKECKGSKEFTNIKFQKLQHLAEHLMEADLNLNYYNQAAGPYDNRFMHTLHKKLTQQKWFDSYGYKYSSLEKVDEIDDYFNSYFGVKNGQFSKLIKLLGKATEDQCEIISTLYAVWNDRLIKGEPTGNDLLIEDFLNWSERKQKYTPDQLYDAIQWMKDKKIEPKGFGKLIKHAKKRKP